MKNLFKNIIAFAMILILLVSTLQFSIYKMECLMSGKTKISLSHFENCNKTNKDNNSITQKCCDFHEITFDFDYNTKINLKNVKVLTPLTLILDINSISLKSVFTKSDFNFYTNLPPPSGYELLKVVQVFRL